VVVGTAIMCCAHCSASFYILKDSSPYVFILKRFYEAAVEGRSLRSSGGLQEEEEEESGEEEPEEGKDYSWKKTIMIGPSYQVNVIEYICTGKFSFSRKKPRSTDTKNTRAFMNPVVHFM
jgi:hypothetical protein